MVPPKEPRKLPAAVSLGKRGGKAGTGKAKRRGDAEYYRKLQAAAVAARKSAKPKPTPLTKRKSHKP